MGRWWLQCGIVGRDGFIGGSWDVVASIGDRGPGGFNGESWDVVASMENRGARWLP